MEIRRSNRNLIFRCLYENGPLSNQDIAYALKISLPTVIQNIKELQEQGFVLECGEFESTGGRKAKAYRHNGGAHCAVGLDITKNHTGIVVVDLDGEILYSERVKCEFRAGTAYFQKLGKRVQKAVAASGVEGANVLGVGVALPAILTEDHQTVGFSPVLGFTGGTLSDFTQAIPYPCILCNDANAACFAELWHWKGREDLVYLSLNNTVGGAVIAGGRLLYGQNQRSGEFGHMTVELGGLTCYCGRQGCLDAYCSALRLSNTAGGSLAEFFRRLEAGDPESETLWEDYLYHLAIEINNLRMAFDCDIVVGGYTGPYMDRYIGRLRELVSQRNLFESACGYLHVCRFRQEATAVGAALHLVDPFLRSI